MVPRRWCWPIPQCWPECSRAVRFRSRVQVNDYLPISRRDLLSFEGPRLAWARALVEAGCRVTDLSFAEVHDCFTIAELLSYEAMGLARPGRGADRLADGTVYLGEPCPSIPREA
jgi:acetyl-CoA C-acetyltransferase